MIRLVALLGLAFGCLPVATSQEKQPPAKKDAPRVLYAMPLVARPGEKQKLTLRGKNLATVKDVTVTGTDGKAKVLAAKAAAPPGNYPADRVGDSEVEIELELPRDAKPGAVTLTAVSPGGESSPYQLLIRDELAAAAENEPNDGFDQARTLAVPGAVEATIKSERDVDVFRFEGKKGERWRVEVQAARFGSPVDALLTVYDAGKRVVDSADDTDGSPDPVLVVTLPADGTYFVTVIEAHDLGGANFGYRLVLRPAK
jgi:hypothetical protein